MTLLARRKKVVLQSPPLNHSPNQKRQSRNPRFRASVVLDVHRRISLQTGIILKNLPPLTTRLKWGPLR
jgi:hypothetical protein